MIARPRSARGGALERNRSLPTHCGSPSTLLVDDERAEALKAQSLELPSLALGQRQLCDLELLLNGGFAPLTGFMGEAVHDSVLETLRLPEGPVWPMPVTLDVDAATAATLEAGVRVALRDHEGLLLAVLAVEDCWKVDKEREAQCVYGTRSIRHPGVRHLHEQTGSHYVGGRVEGVELPTHYDYEELRHTPGELRALFAKLGWRRVIACHTSRPMHRLEHEITMKAAKAVEELLLIHPVVRLTRPEDIRDLARVKCYKARRQHYPHGLAALSLLPLAARSAGPREALWHAVVRRNYGCTHLIVGSDHASPPDSPTGDEYFYPSYAAQELIDAYRDELGLTPVPFRRHGYSEARRRFVPVGPGSGAEPGLDLNDRELARRLVRGEEVPAWFSFPSVLRVLRRVHPPRRHQGLTLFFTGLSGSGKSTLARILYGKFIEDGRRPATLLDGDIVRQNLSSELGFSRAHRDLNVRRIGFVASEITKNAGVAICAPIAPYASTRRAVREMVEAHGAMVEIHVSTALEVCEARDRKGLYARARRGLIKDFTGISDPYEVPENPEIRIDTADLTPAEAAQQIYLYLLREGYLDLPDPMDGEGREVGSDGR